MESFYRQLFFRSAAGAGRGRRRPRRSRGGRARELGQSSRVEVLFAFSRGAEQGTSGGRGRVFISHGHGRPANASTGSSIVAAASREPDVSRCRLIRSSLRIRLSTQAEKTSQPSAPWKDRRNARPRRPPQASRRDGGLLRARINRPRLFRRSTSTPRVHTSTASTLRLCREYC